jgi:DUF4097 and DUF4098 domain-containing protein YvlB
MLGEKGGDMMRRSAKIWLVVAIALILIGVMTIESVMIALHWDLEKLSTNKYETNEYVIDEDYSNISIVTDTADVVLVPSKDGRTTVVCHEQEKERHSAAVMDGTLTIELSETKRWYDHIGINFGTPKITVYVPKGEYGALSIKLSTGDVTVPREFKFESLDISASTGDVSNAASAKDLMKIKTTTGHIRVENVSAGALELCVSTGQVTASRVSCEGNMTLTVSTGKAYLSDITCQDFTSSGNTGDISLENVIVAGKISIERTTGDVELDDCDAAELWIKTGTGDVEGSLLSEKVFIVHTSTGEIDVPRSTSGGKCEITTSTGDVEFEIR